MNILITGGNGFLGSHLIKKLILEGHFLYVFSNSTTNINDILDQVQFDFGYVEDIIKFKDKIIQFSPDIILYNGWSGGNNYNDINNPNQFHNNITPGISFIEILKDLPKKPKFVGFGTILEYGYHSFPIDESYNESPIDLYGLSKLTFSKYSKIMCDIYGIEWVWVRLGYNYGPGDVKTRLIPSIINKCLKNEDIILDECNKTIDYLYIDDFTEFISNLISTDLTGLYNISSGNQYNLKEIINIIYTLSNSKSKIIFDSNLNRKLTSPYMCCDNTKITRLTNILPKVDIKTGILKTINYYKNEL